MTRLLLTLSVLAFSGQAWAATEDATTCRFKGQPTTKLVINPDPSPDVIDHIVIGSRTYEARHAGGSTGIPGRAWIASIGGKEVTYFINGKASRLIRPGRKDVTGTCRNE